MSTFKSLHILNYRIWFVGALISNIGTWMQRTAQDWLVFAHLTAHDAGAVGITMALQLGPQLFLAPVAGLVADRFNRKRLLVLTQSAMALLSAGLGILVVTGAAQLWHVYAFALMLGRRLRPGRPRPADLRLGTGPGRLPPQRRGPQQRLLQCCPDDRSGRRRRAHGRRRARLGLPHQHAHLRAPCC